MSLGHEECACDVMLEDFRWFGLANAQSTQEEVMVRPKAQISNILIYTLCQRV